MQEGASQHRLTKRGPSFGLPKLSLFPHPHHQWHNQVLIEGVSMAQKRASRRFSMMRKNKRSGKQVLQGWAEPLARFDLSVSAWRLTSVLQDESEYLVLQPGLIDQANGSAYIETGNTKIACAM